MHNNTKLIVFEGLDGSGKTTQIKLLKTKLLSEGYSVKVLRLPGKLKKFIKECSKFTLYLFLADQALFLNSLETLENVDYLLSDEEFFQPDTCHSRK